VAYVSIPKDLSKVKTKIALGLTKRQLLLFPVAGVTGFLLFRAISPYIGSQLSIFIMITAVFPIVFLSFERGDLPPEKMLIHYIRAKFLWPKIRVYKTDNLYKMLVSGGEVYIGSNNDLHGRSNNKSQASNCDELNLGNVKASRAYVRPTKPKATKNLGHSEKSNKSTRKENYIIDKNK